MFYSQIDATAVDVVFVLDQILSTGQIAQADAQRVLRAAMTLETPLSAEEQAKVKDIFYRLGLGVLKVVY
jgi:hypothetical protein